MLGQPLAAATAGPQRRNALMTFLLPLAVVAGGIVASTVLGMILRPLALVGSLVELAGCAWMILLTIQMVNELKVVTRNDAFAWWPIFVPLYQFYWAVVLLPQEVKKAKQLLGVQQPVRSPVLYLFLMLFALASDINDLVR
jgi:hypothetical protein